MEKEYGCDHYKKKCELLAPCCNTWYMCRHCHNENYKGPEGPGCTVEQLPRTKVTKVRCLLCKTEQEPSSKCTNCGETFARYYCSKCVFYDDSPDKDIFHCDDCGMCRVGKKEDSQHCFNCGLCINKLSQDKHQCMEIRGQNCPICLESLFESVKPYIQLMRCRHWIHVECFDGYCHSIGISRCPICGTSLVVMKKSDIEILDMIVEEAKEQLPPELKGKKVDIVCLDCLEKSEGVEFSLIAMKCANCGSYNTRQ